ncbi:MAG TPA: TonB-dependent receptor [Puia sp.]
MSQKHLFVLALLASGQAAFAQNSPDTTAKPLDQVVVTATKFPVKQSQLGKVLDVITRDQIEKSGGKQLTEVLNTQAGIVVAGAQNNLGSGQSIYIQGADAGKTLILIDGIPAYDPSGTSTNFDINLVNLDEVERVEILKGSQSTLYGSDAVAGVINIITKKGNGKPFNATAGVAGGSFGTFKGSAGVDGKIGGTGYNIQYTHLQSDGRSSAYDTTGKGHFDNDGFNENLVMANISQKVTDNFGLRGNFQYGRYSTDIDGGAYSDDKLYTTLSKNIQAGIGGDYKLGLAMLHFNYNYNNVKRHYLDDTSSTIAPGNYYYKADFTGRSHYADLYSTIAVDPHVDILAGVDYRNQQIANTDNYGDSLSPDSARVRQFAAYASVLLKNLGGFNIGFGGRYNSFNHYGNVVTYSVNPSFVINDRFKFFADLSSGFSAPTLYQLYSPYRNPNGLVPERSLTGEGGIQYNESGLNLRALYFRRHTKNEIVFAGSGYENLDKQDAHGFEVEAAYKYNIWSFTGNYTYTNGTVTTAGGGTKDTTYNNLYQRPKNVVNASIGVQATKGLFLSIALRTVGQRISNIYGGPRAQADGFAYYTLNGYAEYRLGKMVRLFADFKNITDQRYFDIPGYTSFGFNFMTGISVHL